MKLVILLFVLLGVVIARADAPPLTPPQLSDLKNFETSYCAWCHGNTGNMAMQGSAKLAGQSPWYLENQLANFISQKRDDPDGREIMWNAVTNLDPALIPYLAQYYAGQPTTPNTHIDQNLAATGKAIYLNGLPQQNVLACAVCHGSDAKGIGAIPRLASQDKFYFEEQMRDWKEGYRAYAVPMPDYAKALNDNQVKALAEYLSSL